VVSTKHEVTVSTHGLYVKGKSVRVDAQVYVWAVNGSMQPIQLTGVEYEQIRAGVDEKAHVWLDKVEPSIDEEYHRGPYAHIMHPEDCEYLKKKGDDSNEQ
jgi:hypothetical protein